MVSRREANQKRSIPAKKRFWGFVQKGGPGECWEWTGAKTSTGYGAFSADGRPTGAHCWSIQERYGLYADGYHIDHLCETPSCVNPEHLEVVTQEENIRRSNWPSAVNARKTHCSRGHPLEGDNVYLYKSPRGRMSRTCRQCQKITERRIRFGRAEAEGRTIGIAFKERTHCPHGHPYSGVNLYIKPSGARSCRECKRAYDRRRRAQRGMEPRDK